ncbi:hypothetical protein A11Q_1003 [Pseudobdellovibrio exovorus JSS]|uniref:3-deoxy-D-manno-octulosonic acid transferase n=2 Tax=Pseudobdellovibrio exovorus TaxID=453816 RepID=M4VPZ7_9BACT|nr:hypothetical protein A11Q_1003 [Pseudobdellovibrio exovorus JSS]
MIYFYRLIYFTLRVLLFVISPVLPKSLQLWIKLRREKLSQKNNFKNSYWFHASSGEIEYCKSVIRLLKTEDPKAHVVVTYSSPSAEKLFFNISQFVDEFIPLPWDQPFAIKRLIQYIQPRVLVFARTDLWPELIYQVKKQRIPVGVISYNPRLSSLNHFVNRHLLSQLDFISCLQEQIIPSLQLITRTKIIKADGDTRFDQVFFRLSQEPKVKIANSSSDSAPLFICGSTWAEDEAVLFPCFNFLIENKFKIALCPHDVSSSNIARLRNDLEKYGWSYQLLSESQDLQRVDISKNILLVDQVGYLADLYRFGSVAFVGGSFKDKVHSVMEPLCCGLPVAVGPFYHNNPEAVRYVGQSVIRIESPQELTGLIKNISTFDKEQILTEMQKNQNASQRALDTIKESIKTAF